MLFNDLIRFDSIIAFFFDLGDNSRVIIFFGIFLFLYFSSSLLIVGVRFLTFHYVLSKKKRNFQMRNKLFFYIDLFIRFKNITYIIYLSRNTYLCYQRFSKRCKNVRAFSYFHRYRISSNLQRFSR